MKKVAFPCLVILLSAVLFMSVSFNVKQLKTNEFTLSGDVSKLKQKIGYIRLAYMQNGGFKVDSTKVVNGRFFFKDTLNEPSFAFLSIESGNAAPNGRIYDELFIEPGTIKVVCGNSFTDITITGSKSDIEYKKWLEARKSLDSRLDSMFKVEDQLGDTYLKNGKTHADSLTLAAAGEKTMQIGHDRREFDLGYLKSHMHSLIAPNLMNILVKDPRYTPKIKQIYNELPVSLQNTPTGKVIKMQFISKIGSIAPDISVPDTNGHQIVLSSLRSKYVLLDFWASWCGPCRAESPYLIKSFRKYQDKFTILSVSLDTRSAKKEWLNAIRQDGTGLWLQKSSLNGYSSKEAALYGINIIPTNFLIDKEGRIVAKNLRGADLEKKLDELLK